MRRPGEAGAAEEWQASRRGLTFHPVLIEVAGGMEDEIVHDVTQRLRQYRNRYTPLLRCMFTLVATAVPEAELFGDEPGLVTAGAEGSSSSGSSRSVGRPTSQRVAPLFTAPRCAVSVNKVYPLVRRLYTSPQPRIGDASMRLSPVSTLGTLLGESETATSALLLPWVDCSEASDHSSITATATATATTAAACRQRAVHQLEEFMSYHFLPFAMTHNTLSPPTITTTDAASPSAPAALSAERTFVLRHYVNEASRTSSFLFADPYHSPCMLSSADVGKSTALQAVLIDPREEQVEAYLADIAALDATLSCVIFTHCYVDGSAGLSALVAHFPAVRVVSGLPLAPAGTRRCLFISSYLCLSTVAIPAFSPECLLVEVHAGGTLVGLCPGVLWSTDAAPRWDLLQWSSYPAAPQTSRSTGLMNLSKHEEHEEEGKGAAPYGGDVRDAALAHTHRVLKEFFFDPYLAPLCGTATPTQERDRPGKSARAEGDAARDETNSAVPPAMESSKKRITDLQRVVLLPTHGGYSNVTNQLDLYWAVHLGDLCRMKHSRTVIDTLATSADVFVKYHKRLPRLPHPPLFDASRVFHARQLLHFMSAEQRARCVAQLPADMGRALTNSFDPFFASMTGGDACSTNSSSSNATPHALTSFVNVVDVRDAKDYHALHLSGAVNVPMSFPGVAYGARRAELWLQCVLVPHQPVLVLCAAASQRAEVKRRLTALSPGCTVVVFTLEDLPHFAQQEVQPPPPQQSTSAFAADAPPSAAVPWHEFHCERPRGLPAETPIPQDVVWVRHANALARLTTYEHLIALEPTDTHVVMDVRTPYEFKNGSHQHSVHVELSEMCTLAVEDAIQASSSSSLVQNHHRNSNNAEEVRWRVGSSPRLADVYLEKLHTSALLAGLPVVRQETSLSDVVIYCAGGYRSLIAASLLQRAVETSANPAWRALHIADVAGGAFQIMTQRPDLWRVKDRSIICIS
ncbi:hypothetical protein ABB37_03270 [Leptomonas pyrrhocoris]|uniref:Rhodanese domain-containing protein n=1 Tax=Leptomonas pyrrhocoris TaxID=157538 RepID=A0A0N0DWR3_LEPPY|nr:hypothetical protein ABB37_03270 [Leptomonas pyrrhocoris]KPA82125.1 hypothetical protein ABB37_03270 [Leptomonas pyrrhocoris]|eukprot:XP_015660564.1 hypothetical protein ABB37_03270 [Leptomonas pyrrhocoris]